MDRYWVLLVPLLVVLGIAVAFTALPSSNLDDDQVLHFDFDQNVGAEDHVTDVSGERNHGSIVAESDQQPNVTDGAMHFGEGSPHARVDLEDQPLEGEFTLVVEVRNQVQEYHAGVVSTDRWRLTAPYDRYGFYTTDGGIDSSNYDEQDWSHLIVVHRDGQFELYMNGESAGDLDVSDENVSADTIYIGQRPNGYPLEGEIAAVQIYDRAVSPEEVTALYVGRAWLHPVFFSTEFRTTAAITVALLALGAARIEVTRTDG